MRDWRSKAARRLPSRVCIRFVEPGPLLEPSDSCPQRRDDYLVNTQPEPALR
ncbi:MAG TPA: hypothetical protein VHY37_06745 [Tepidisphaeraceae bacterium]|nr:hypothetical protein [Tepidisphaeraceae bacterium]